MYSKRVVTLLLIFLLLSSCAFIGLRSIRIDKKGTHFRIPNLITAYNVDLRSSFAGGNGTENDPYQISNLSQLQDMNLDLFADYMLVRDIDASKTKDWNNGKVFYPIGDDSGAGGNRFYGSFNGKGHNITELYINRSPWYETGLFGCVSNNAYVHNITLVDNKVNGHRDVGGIVGWNCGIVENCYATGNVSGDWDVGGLVGTNIGLVRNCSAIGNVNGDSSVGGLIGDNRGVVQKCYAIGNISGSWDVGGLVGSYKHSYSMDQISNSFYCINYIAVKNKHYVTPFGIYKTVFEDWINSNKSLNIDDYLFQIPGTNDYNISSVSDMKNMLQFGTFPG